MAVPALGATALPAAGKGDEPVLVSRAAGAPAAESPTVAWRLRRCGFASRVGASSAAIGGAACSGSSTPASAPRERAPPEVLLGAGFAVSVAGSTLVGEPADDFDPRVLTRDSFLGDDESEDDDPADDPADPVVSAAATAGEMIAAPTPNAMASAPTRPM